jgi:phosphoribosylamine--glycine ligase
MNVLLLGSGGREHALALALSKSPRLGKLIIAPGNPGTALLGENCPIDMDDHPAIIDLCRRSMIEFVVVGPEAPLVAGLVDDLSAVGINAFGPTGAAAQLEGSKGFTKDLCRRHAIPTPAYRRFRAVEPALRYIRQKEAPIVVKADGLASGKGVLVATTLSEAEAAVRSIFTGAFGSAGRAIVIEDFVEGEEISFFALCDGERAVAFASAQDHKRLHDGDGGPNTGGMGAYSPAPMMTPALNNRVMREIVEPTLRALAARGAPFRGMLFAGLMLTRDGPQLIEYNVRFGDPECQVMMLRLEEDLLSLLIDSATQRLSSAPVRLSTHAALTVVMAARGYPEAPRKRTPIGRLGQAAAMPGVTIFQAATRLENGQLLADGGRVLNVSAVGTSIEEARERAYAAVDQLDWPGGFCRRDIGCRVLVSSAARPPAAANRP